MIPRNLTRRRAMRFGGSAAALALAGCSALVGSQGGSEVQVTATAQDGGDGTALRGAGRGHVDVKMTTASDGSYRFDPGIAHVRPGGSVTWTVTSGVHTTTAYHPTNGKPQRIPTEAASWNSGMLRVEGSFTHTFETEGVYNYLCQPHEGNGMVGAVIVGEPTVDGQPGLAAPQDSLPTAASTALEGLVRTVKERLGVLGLPTLAEVTMTQADDGTFAFEPEVVRVRRGGAIRWTVESGAHTATAYHTGNGKPQRVPDGTSVWDSGLLSEGETFERTFDANGVYDYHCMPHESNGMVGSVIVGDPRPGNQPALTEPQDVLTAPTREKLSALNQQVVDILEGDVHRGRDESESGSTVEVAMKATSDGTFAFEPSVAYVEPGDTVRWKLESGTHTTTAYHPDNDKPLRTPDGAAGWDSGIIAATGETFEHTFEADGVYDYFCMPHEAMGMVGSVVVGDPDLDDEPGLAAPQDGLPAGAQEAITSLNQAVQKKVAEGATHTPTPTSTPTPTPTPQGPAAKEEAVSYAFQSDLIRIQPGDTVEWTVEEGMHTITAYHPDNDKSRRAPYGAASFDSGYLQAGESFSHTFETAGVYDYYCSPHESMGMVGSVIVGDPAPDPDTEPGLSSPQNDVAAPAAITDLNQRAIEALGGSSGAGTSTPTPTPTPASGGSSGTVDVSIPGERFDPDLVHVQAGDTVRWTLQEGGHTVTAYHPTNDKPQRVPDGAASFDSGLLKAGETFTHTFETAGVYDYFCMPHEPGGMLGSVIVGNPADAKNEPGLAEPQASLPTEARRAIRSLNQRAKQELGLDGGGSQDQGSDGDSLAVCGNYERWTEGAIHIASDGEICPGISVTITATLDGVAAADAIVAVNGDRVGTTDSNGQLKLSIPDGNRLELEVETDDYWGGVTIRWN